MSRIYPFIAGVAAFCALALWSVEVPVGAGETGPLPLLAAGAFWGSFVLFAVVIAGLVTEQISQRTLVPVSILSLVLLFVGIHNTVAVMP